uniref:Uncharacterized protein n=1 Tax=Strigamia maritima TaxID=126957 RepID=T1IQW3_STRMM
MLNQRNNDSDEDGELFPAEASEDGFSSEDDANSNMGDPQLTTAPANFAAELAAKLGVSQQVSANKEKSDKQEQKIDVPKRNKRKESKPKDRDDTIPPEIIHDQISDDEEDSLFTRKNTLFGSGGGLFDDLSQDDENDLFSEVKSKPKTQKEASKKKESKSEIETLPKKKSVSLFDDVEDDLFSSVKMDDDLKAKKSSPVVKRSSIDESDSLERKKSVSKVKKSSIGDSNSLERKNQRAASLFCDADDEDDDLFSTATRKKTKSIHVEKDDDLFSSREHTASSSEGTPKKKLPAGAVSMFGSATNPMTELMKAHRHFSESEKEETDSEWSTPERTLKPVEKTESPHKKTETKENIDVLASGGPKIIPEPKKEIPTRPARAISLFDDDDDDADDLFSNIKTKPEVPKEKIEVPKPPKLSSDSSKTSSLFDAEDDPADDIFQKKPESSSPKLRTTSLFDDEDILFGGPSEDAPSVDLFKIPENSEEQPESPKEVATNSEKRKKSLVFDMTEDEEDLFSTPVTTKSSSVPIPAARKSSAIKNEPNSPKIETQTKKKPTGGISLFGGIDPFAGKLKKEPEVDVIPEKHEEKPQQIETDDVAEKKPNEPILPALSMKPLPSPVDTPVSFEDPVEPHTLKSTCKNRATVQKRRPPTRKGRKAQPVGKIEVDFNDIVVSSPEEPRNDVGNILSPSTEEEDMFPVDELVVAKASPDFNRRNTNEESTETKRSDLFASLDSKPSDEDDIFAVPTRTKSVLVDDDDDLFSSASKTSEKSVKKSVKKDLFGDTKKKTVASLFDDDSEDDIFASKTSTSTKPVPKSTLPKNSKGLFDDDDDDVSIFDDPLMVKRGNL